MAPSSSSPLSTDKKMKMKNIMREKKTNVLDPDKMMLEGKRYSPSSDEEFEHREEKLSDNHSSEEEENTMKEYNRSSSDAEKISKQEEEKLRVLQSFNAGVQLHMDLPLGYRFWPANHELIKPYLYSKILGEPVDSQPILDPNPIREINLSDYDPNDIPFDESCKPNEAYFYTCLQHKCVQGSVLRVVTKSGYWEVTGTDVPVYSDKEEKVMVGFKKNWAFFWGQPPTGKKSLWKMSELRVNPLLISNYRQDDNLKFKMLNYAVCKIKKQLL